MSGCNTTCARHQAFPTLDCGHGTLRPFDLQVMTEIAGEEPSPLREAALARFVKMLVPIVAATIPDDLHVCLSIHVEKQILRRSTAEIGEALARSLEPHLATMRAPVARQMEELPVARTPAGMARAAGVPEALIREAERSGAKPQSWAAFAGAWRKEIDALGQFAAGLLEKVHEAAAIDAHTDRLENARCDAEFTREEDEDFGP